MTIYILQGRYSAEAIKGMVAEPEDRAASVAKLLAALGGRLVSYYLTFGEYDFLVVAEAPGDQAALMAAIIAAASGSITDLKTTVAVSSSDAMRAFEGAKGYLASFRAAGNG